MQYVFFEKGIYDVQWGLGPGATAKPREAWEFSRIFVLKVT